MRARYIVIFLISFVISSCDLLQNKAKMNNINDTFYSDLGGLDRPRIPLIKPYELLKISDSEWHLELQNPGLLVLSIHNVKGVCIHDSLIAIYSKGEVEFQNKLHEKAWFIIEPRRGLEKAFENELTFNDAYSKSKNGQKIHFYSPDSLYKSFEEQRKIVW